ncbi:MAG: right-handed parallel beta-helix repeat-containing protein [Pseudomonadota bacterium]|nr:right-handed parallel beta-helix repeat-containing protein [Pseudomonadota bacterium]
MLLLLPAAVLAATLQVGPDKAYATPCAAAPVVQDGDTVEIDAGTYAGDACAWTANGLTLRGVGGLAHLDAAGAAAQGKAIWVIQGDDTTVEWIEFSGASVPDHNGAGIRQEGTNLTVSHCYFHDNENGVLAGDNPDSDIVVTDSEFADNGYGDGQSHNLYINHVRSFTFRFSDSHHAYKGHALKSRAARTWVLYSRLADEADGQGSYQIDLPNGGFAVVMGNVIQQGPAAENGGMLSFAAEGATNPEQALYVVNNSFVNDRGSGTFVRNASEADAVVVNNLFVGGGTALDGPGAPVTCLETGDPGFVAAAAADYTLAAGSPAIDAGSDPGTADGTSLWPAWHVPGAGDAEARPVVGPLDLGAYEWGESEPAEDTGTDSGDAADTGCGCAAKTDIYPTFPLVLVLVALRRRRRNPSAAKAGRDVNAP